MPTVLPPREPSCKLSASLLNPDGSVHHRWGADERAVEDIPKGLSFSTSDPGGFKDCSLALSRRIDRDWPDLRLLRDIELYGRGERTAWEGRLNEIPTHHSTDFTISPGAVGHVAELDDDPSFREIYAGRDVNEWRGTTSARRQFLDSLKWTVGDGSVEQDPASGIAALRMSIHDTWPTSAVVESYYDAGPGCRIARITWERTSVSNYGPSEPNVSFSFLIFLSDNDTLTAGYNLSEDAHTAVADSDPPSFYQPGAPRRWAGFQWAFPAPGGVAGNTFDTYIKRPAVFGDHVVPLRGLLPNQGVYIADVMADIVRRTAPRLRYTTGPDGSIAESNYICPHLVYKTPGKGSDAILAANAFHQRSWGVYDDRTFFWQPTNVYRKRWRIRRSKGHGVDLLGPQAEDAINGVIGTFTDPSGVTRTVGPPGCTTVDATSALLQDTSPGNPVNQAGIARKWGEVQLGFVTDIPGALQVCAEWMAMKLSNATSRGSIVVTGCVEDDETGILYPPWYMRACDSAIVVDGDNIERRIIETRYEHDSLTNTLNLDTTPHKFDAQMERMGVALVGVAE